MLKLKREDSTIFNYLADRYDQMTELVPPESIKMLLDATRTQIDMITTLSSGGFGVIILTWGRSLGILDDANLSAFRKPAFLMLPAGLLLSAVAIGYFAGAQTTAYYTEIARGLDSSSGAKIADPCAYYFKSYDTKFHWMMLGQLCTSIAGIVIMAGWFAWNILTQRSSR